MRDALRELGHEIVSTWHDNERSTVAAESKLIHGERQGIGWQCAREIREASRFVVIYDAPGGRSGHVWEAGYYAGLAHRLGAPYAIPFNEHSSVPCVFLHSHALLLPGVPELLEYLS